METLIVNFHNHQFIMTTTWHYHSRDEVFSYLNNRFLVLGEGHVDTNAVYYVSQLNSDIG